VNLRRRLSLVLIPTVVLLTGAAGYLALLSTERYHDQELRESVLSLARTISLNLRREPDLSDARRLYSFIRQLRDSDPRILDATVVDAEGEITGDLDERQVYSHATDEDLLDVLRGGGRISRTRRMGDSVFKATVPIYFEGSERPLGALRLSYDLSSTQAIQRTARLRLLLAVAAIAVLLILALSAALTRLVVRPLNDFATQAAAIAAGDLGARVPAQRTEELGVLRRSFNTMAASLEASLASLEKRHEALEAEVRDRTADLSSARDRLEILNRALEERVEERTGQLLHAERLSAIGTLASGVAHEINNPLATILTCSEGLLRAISAEGAAPPGVAGEKMQEYLATIREEARRCRTITSQLLDFSRRRTGTRQLTDLRSVVRESVGLVQPKAAAESKSVDSLLPGHPLAVHAEPGALKQLVLNLVLNALDASPAGATVKVTLIEERDLATILVEDQGRGLAPDEMARAFEPFFTTKTTGRGTGLGLAICDMIVHQHDGEIRLESAGPGMGARATVTLPLATESVGVRT